MKKRPVFIALICMSMLFCACGKNDEASEVPANGEELNAQGETVYGDDALIMDGDFSEEYTDEETLLLLNAYTFAKTEDGFINNDDLEAQVGPDILATHANAMATEMNMLYTVNATELRADSGKYRYRFRQFISDNCVTPDGNSFVDAWVDTVIQSEASLTGTFKTTKDMVFYDDDELYVRGLLTLKVNACSDTETLSKMLPVNVMVGGTYSFIYDVAMELSDTPVQAQKVVSIKQEEAPAAETEEDEVIIEDETKQSDTKESENKEEPKEETEQIEAEAEEIAVKASSEDTSESNLGKIDHIFAVASW